MNNITDCNQKFFINNFTELLKNLRSADPNQRNESLQKITELNDPLLIPPCRDLIKNRDPLLRFIGCEMLGNMSDFESIPNIIACLCDEDKNVRLAACRSLAKVPDVRSVTPLLNRMKDSDPHTRKAALQALDTLGDCKLASAILEARYETLIEIAFSGDPRALDPLLELAVLKNNNASKLIKSTLQKIFDKFEPEIDKMLCATHFTRFQKFSHNRIKKSTFSKLPYFGCRHCRRSISAMTGVRMVIAVLDNKMKSYALFDNGVLEVNYLHHDSLFDFDKVDIRRADTDTFKFFTKRLAKNPNKLMSKKFSSICCEIHRDSGLPISDIEFAKTIFGKVKLSEKYH